MFSFCLLNHNIQFSNFRLPSFVTFVLKPHPSFRDKLIIVLPPVVQREGDFCHFSVTPEVLSMTIRVHRWRNRWPTWSNLCNYEICWDQLRSDYKWKKILSSTCSELNFGKITLGRKQWPVKMYLRLKLPWLVMIAFWAISSLWFDTSIRHWESYSLTYLRHWLLGKWFNKS